MARTKGAKTVQRDVVTLEPSRCRKCSSTNRSEYKTKTIHEIDGTSPGGFVYNRVVYRHTCCLDCGQARVDRTFEFIGKASKAKS